MDPGRRVRILETKGEAPMKVRWSAESLRLRITPTELATLVMGGELTTALALPGDPSWSVTVSTGADASDLVWAGRGFTVLLTDGDVARLADGDTEGVYFWTTGDRPIRYFIEKDFPCAHPHAQEACEPETERFTPTESYLRRKNATLGATK